MARKKGVGDIGGDLILLGAVGVGAYLLITQLSNLLKGAVTNSAQGQNQTDTAATTNQAAASDLAASQAKGITQTLTATQIASIATGVTQAFADQDPPDMQTAFNLVTQCNNVTDWNALLVTFGTRNFNPAHSIMCNVIGVDCTQLGLLAAIQTAVQVLANEDQDNSPTSEAGVWATAWNSFFSDIGVNAQIQQPASPTS